ncbi:acetyltransferase [Oscillatoriales cyanobacterium USR001]|nr:acetyltransferase [Oscillatoriales cyanobacterium USR001]
MTTLTMRSYRGESDWRAIADLVNACQIAEELDEEATVCELKLKLNAPYLDKSRDVQLWETQHKLTALALLDIPETKHDIDGYLWFYIHPSMRGMGLENDIINWSEKRLSEVGRERNLPVKLRTYTRDNNTLEIGLLEKQGFVIDRYFLTMARSLWEPIPTPEFPADFKLSHLTGEKDAQAWVEMFNESFIDHWNHHDLTVQTVRQWMKDSSYQPELDLVAIAPNGTFAAFCDCQIKAEENAQKGTNDGWIEFLGTRRGFRQMGLGKAILLAGLHQLKAAGADTAKLSVDADSLTGATKLYKSVGFYPVQTWLSWAKPLFGIIG